MPPQIPGYQKFDLYPAGRTTRATSTKAKEALTACGQPNGFETNIAYRAERPKEKATAESLQQSLARVGIKLTLKPYPQGDYFSLYAGNPPSSTPTSSAWPINGWGADWNDGFGFLSQIVDSRVIRETGGSSNLSVRIPEVDKMLDKALAETDPAKRERDLGRDRQAGHGGGGRSCRASAPSACCSARQGPDQRIRQRGVRHVRLPVLGVAVATSNTPSSTT